MRVGIGILFQLAFKRICENNPVTKTEEINPNPYILHTTTQSCMFGKKQQFDITHP